MNPAPQVCVLSVCVCVCVRELRLLHIHIHSIFDNCKKRKSILRTRVFGKKNI